MRVPTQRRDQAGSVSGGALLAGKPFSDQSRNRDFHTNKVLRRLLHENRRGFGKAPRARGKAFVLGHERREVLKQPGLIVNKARDAIGIDDCEIPARQHFLAFLTGDLPTRRDICVWSLKNHQRFHSLDQLLPQWIAASKVTA